MANKMPLLKETKTHLNKAHNMKKDWKLNPRIRSAVAEHQPGKATTTTIAIRYGVSPATLTNWVRKLGLQIRSRGRKAYSAPPPLHAQILEEARTASYQQVANRHGLSRQRVHQIVSRWDRNLAKQRPEKIRKTTARGQAKDDARGHVVCFRLRDEEVGQLGKLYPSADSINLAARELVLAALTLRTKNVYKNANTVSSSASNTNVTLTGLAKDLKNAESDIPKRSA